MVKMVNEENEGVVTYNMTYEPAPTIEYICKVISSKGNVPVPKIKLPSWLLLLTSKGLYGISNKEGVHPDRVKKLMISNNIKGLKLSSKYNLEYGLENGILDWMEETNFFKSKEIY